MPSYNSSYTGIQIDDAIMRVITAKNNGGLVSGNELTNTLTAYLTLSDAANTYLTQTNATNTYQPLITAGTTGQFYRGDKTWSNTLNGQSFIIDSTHDEQIIEMHKSGVKKNQLDSSTNSYILWSNKTASAGTLSWQKSIEIDRATNLITLYGNVQYPQGYRLCLGMNNSVCMDGCLATYYSDASSFTGTIKITLPLNNGDCVMQILEVWIYDYNSLGGSQLVISGYSYINKDWHNYRCKVNGNYNKGVRMAFDGTNYCILLGTTSTTWNYTKVWLTRWMGGYSNRASMYNKGLPTISLITSESGYTITGSAT